MSLLRKLAERYSASYNSEWDEILDLFQKEVTESRGHLTSEDQIKNSETFGKIQDLEPPQRCEFALFLLQVLVGDTADPDQSFSMEERIVHAQVSPFLCQLLKRKQEFSSEQFTKLARTMRGLAVSYYGAPQAYFPATSSRYLKQEGQFNEEQIAILEDLVRHWEKFLSGAKKWSSKLRALLPQEQEAPSLQVFANGEPFADQLVEFLKTDGAKQAQSWAKILAHAQDSQPGKPTRNWENKARELLDELGKDKFASTLISLLPLVDKPATKERGENHGDYSWNLHELAIAEPHLAALKGLTWMAGFLENDELTRVLGFVGVSAHKKIPGLGARATRLGNSCIWALGNIGSETALAQLALMKAKVKFGTAQKGIAKALAKVAEQVGVTPEELEEMSVPSYGLTEVGRLEEKLGEYTAVLEVKGSKPILTFLKPDGKPQKSVPAAIKESYASDLKEIRGSGKDLEKMLSAQRERLDNLFLKQKEWTYQIWKSRYLDHPVVGIMARKLIWFFKTPSDGKTISAIYFQGQLTSLEGPLAQPDDETIVSLWHPVLNETKDVVQWRNWLFEHMIQQPFKQAHREVYLLTDAERNTASYSNRFASHVLKQHQFNSLCAVRGWKNTLRLMVDDQYPPASKVLEEWGLRAEYWVEGLGDDYTDDFVVESGAYRYLATDQVRFYDINSAQATAHAGGGGYGAGWQGSALPDPIPIAEVPPLVLSEILRDVDLFVGVTSVGNDPSWNDGGPGGHHRDYWSEYAFGELGESAETRKEILTSLLPRLKIGSACRIEGRFLLVEGTKRVYKIHLGSGNILMEPNDQYLCIVKAPPQRKSGDVFLPFEGDGKMATILSKAFLLAADDQITDATILSQIG